MIRLPGTTQDVLSGILEIYGMRGDKSNSSVRGRVASASTTMSVPAEYREVHIRPKRENLLQSSHQSNATLFDRQALLLSAAIENQFT